MQKFLVQNLEAYLAGQLGQADQRKFEARLQRSPRDREAVEQMAGMSDMFSCFDLPQGDVPGPSPGFHQRVLRSVEAQRGPDLWDMLMQPLMLRRSALVACGWLLALLATNALQVDAQPTPQQIVQNVLVQQPESGDYCNVRLGCDIDLNRSTMLAAVMVSGGNRR